MVSQMALKMVAKRGLMKVGVTAVELESVLVGASAVLLVV